MTATATLLGLLRAVRDGSADAILPLSDAMEEVGREDDAARIRRKALAFGSECRIPGAVEEMVCEQTFAMLAENCPTCGGEGRYDIHEDVLRDDGSIRIVKYPAACVRCRGSGVRLKGPTPDETISFKHHGHLVTVPATGDKTVALDESTATPGFHVQVVSPAYNTGRVRILAPKGEEFYLAPGQGMALEYTPDGHAAVMPYRIQLANPVPASVVGAPPV